MSEKYLSVISECSRLYEEENWSVAKIAKEFSLDRHKLSKMMKENGTVIGRTSSKYRYQEDYFDNINTEEKAYWLGFLYADGYVSEDAGKMEFGLQIGDITTVEKLRDTLVPGKPVHIRKATNSCRLNVTNVPIVKSLISKGCGPRKSLTLQFPTKFMVHAILVKHFIRGYMDGDGCVHITKRPDIVVAFEGTEKFLEELREHIMSKVDVTKTTICSVTNSKSYSWSKTGPDAIKILEYLYEDATIFLERKHRIFTSYLPS